MIGNEGEYFWATIYSFCILAPMAIPRKINALRYTSLFGVMCSVYIMLAVFLVFYCDEKLVPDPL